MRLSKFEFIGYNLICVLDINAHNEQDSTGIKPALPFSAEELNESTPNTGTQSLYTQEIYTQTINGVVTCQKIMNEL